MVGFCCWLACAAGWFLLLPVFCCLLVFAAVWFLLLVGFYSWLCSCGLLVFAAVWFSWPVGFCCWLLFAEALGSSAAPDAPARQSTSRPLQGRTTAVRHSQHVVRGRGPPGRSGWGPSSFTYLQKLFPETVPDSFYLFAIVCQSKVC